MDEKEKVEQRRKKEINLTGIFGIERLKDIIKTMSDATGASFSVIDYKGKNLIESRICNEYCLRYMDQSKMCGECQVTAAFAAAKAAIKCRPYLYYCPQGFVGIAIPIIVNDQYLGAIVGGRVRCDDEIIPGQEGTVPSQNKADEEMERLFHTVPKLTGERIMALADLLFLLLKEMGEKETMELQLDKQTHIEAHLRETRIKNDYLKRELQEVKMKSTKAKIHPHFLLDMFVAVSNYAILENATKTEAFIADIASVLRYYIDETEDQIPLGAELMQMETYLKILKRQYENRLGYHLNYQDSVRKIMIPVLSIFPFLNYVVNFGVLPGSFRGTLFLNVEETNDKCFITIQLDDEEAAVHKRVVCHDMEETVDQRFLMEQIDNTKKRLSYKYGDLYKVKLQPDLVVIELPKSMDNMNEK